MPVPAADPAFLPEWDETKLGKSSFGKLMAAYMDAKAKEAEAAAAAAEYRDQMSALTLKYKVDACRAAGYTVRWNKGATRRTLVPQLLLQNGVSPKILEKSYKVTEGADYFAIIAPRTKKEKEETE